MRATRHTLARREALLAHLPWPPHRKTATELQRELAARGPDYQTTVRTIERDLEALSATHPIEVDRRSRPHGWRWTREAREAMSRALTPGQAVALLMAREHLGTLMPLSLSAELEPLYYAAREVLKESGLRDWPARVASVPAQLQPLAPDLPEGVLAVVQQALAARRCLRLEYRMKGRTEPSSLLVHPVGLLLRGRVTYLVGTLFDGDEGRELALHRISAASLDAAKATPPAGLTLKGYAAKAWAYRSRGVIELVADFDAPAAEHLAETPISWRQRLEPLPDGKVRLTAEVEDGEQLRWWLLGFGSQVVVVLPDVLRKAIASEVQCCSMAYRR